MTPVRAPGYWRDETSGELAPVIMRYLEGAALSQHDIATLRAYLRQWIDATVWDENPHADQEARRELARLRHHARGITSRAGIDRWVADAVGFGIDPL